MKQIIDRLEELALRTMAMDGAIILKDDGTKEELSTWESAQRLYDFRDAVKGKMMGLITVEDSPMNLTEFREFTEKATARRHKMMFEVKQRAYAGTVNEQPDALGNFKRRAVELQMTTKKVIESDLSKHWDQVRYGNLSVETAENIDSRFDDIQNYLDLLRAAYTE